MFNNQGLGNVAAKGYLKLIGVTDDKLKIPINDQKFFNPASGTRTSIGPKKKRVLIYFIGGITQAEIAAIKFLQKLNPSYKYIIATTSIINGETALTQLLGPGTEAQDQGLAVPDILKEK